MSGRTSISKVRPGAVTALYCLALLFAVCLSAGRVGAVERSLRGELKRVLVLHSFGRDFRPWSEYARDIKAKLERQSPWPLDIQEHALLTARFNNPGPEAPFVDYLQSLYQGAMPDIVLSIGAPAARFAQKYRGRLFPDVPLILSAVEHRLINRADLSDNDVVVAIRNDFMAAFRNVLQILPDTKSIVVVIGASPLEKFWVEEVKRELQPLGEEVELVWYSDLSFDEILKRASKLPPHTALFWGLMSVDAAGVVHESDIALRSLYAAANAPIFSYQEPFFGDGTVGGPMHMIAETSSRTVSAAIGILGGAKPASISYEPIGFAAPRYDWRQLQHWGISESRLPPGSEIMFREQSIWERYRWQMLLIASVILVQAGLISGMLHERRRRQIAEVESRQRLAELAHANRYSAVGELTTSIAHELNQPLGSILTNAETAELMLKAASPDIDEIRQILADIRRDDQRASEVIRRLRSILKKTPFEVKDIELNDMVREAIGLVRAVADGRRITLIYTPVLADLHVRGDPIQLQQVVLNLIINAMDAIFDADPGKRQVSVSTLRVGNEAEIRVFDTGPGIAASDLANVFNPFFTTKPQGMGMGLAIAKTIIEAHHGTISAENQAAGGALFTIRLPILH
ncbi:MULTISPECIES: HAMP domain-containing sensor histidine kinase [unclassified Bradyrhizobium]|uniref:sensor histidine kinase n=1 Tax=unclassified Bradyrhizobium TaxID=2631580 RepID=UPI0015CED8BC|nr:MULTISPECIES: HAMP domain-containing sensor histidine kinase [unclassified Bradyrhizobium]MBB4256550.1 signal transduction histidine kinase [Bradyrhizobium sp. CIR3A]NYG43424.1 signal transduction histidine kinase [Bradyrhizobium sp. IAR9]